LKPHNHGNVYVKNKAKKGAEVVYIVEEKTCAHSGFGWTTLKEAQEKCTLKPCHGVILDTKDGQFYECDNAPYYAMIMSHDYVFAKRDKGNGCEGQDDCEMADHWCDPSSNSCKYYPRYCTADSNDIQCKHVAAGGSTGGNPFCATSLWWSPVESECVECRFDMDCPTERPYCHEDVKVCVAATCDPPCQMPDPICARMHNSADGKGQCVQCLDNTHCEPRNDGTNTCVTFECHDYDY